MDNNSKETAVRYSMESVPFLYPEKFKTVLEKLSENNKKIIKELFEKQNVFSKPLKTEIPAPGYTKSDYKEYFGSFINSYTEKEDISTIEKNICEKNKISQDQFVDIELNYLEELYKGLNDDFIKLKNIFYEKLNKDKEKILNFSDLAFLDKDSLDLIINEIDFSDLFSIISREKECIKSIFIKELFNKYKTTQEKLFLAEDFIFNGNAGPANFYNYQLLKSEVIINLKKLVKSGQIKLPEHLIFPTDEYLEEQNNKIKELNDEKQNSLEITDILYIEERSLIRLLENEEIKDEDIYALLYKYKQTELFYEVYKYLLKDFQQKIEKYNDYFKNNQEEVNERINNIKNIMIQMRNNGDIIFKSDGLWITNCNEIIFLDDKRHIKKYDIQSL